MGKYSDGSGVDPRWSLTTAPCISQEIVEANVHSGKVFYRGELNRVYPIMERGEGVCIYDSEGNKYLDAMSGYHNDRLTYATTAKSLVAGAWSCDTQHCGFAPER